VILEMAEASFYLIYIERDPSVSLDEVKTVLDRALNWFRLNSRVWIVYTTSDAEKWYGRLKHLVQSDGNVFICRLDISGRQGWMSREFWRWFHETEKKEYGESKS
jgi:hypothetical protein